MSMVMPLQRFTRVIFPRGVFGHVR